MRRRYIYTLSALFLILSFGSIGQQIETKLSKNYWLGLNTGYYWLSSDVKNYGGWGLGLNLEKQLIYNDHNTFGLSLRGNYLYGSTVGQNNQLSSIFNENPMVNGQIGPDYTGEKVIYNYQSKINTFALDAVIFANRLRAQTGINLYAFGGIGRSGYTSSSNYLDENGSIYDFEDFSVDPSSTYSILQFQDDSYETSINQNGTTWVNSPSLGAGIGFPLGKNITFGFEYRRGFTQTDILDASIFSANGQKTTNDDRFNYLSFGLGINLGKWNSSATASSNPKVNGRAPEIVVRNPTSLNFVANNCLSYIKANVYYIDNKDQIEVYHNQQKLEPFNYTYNSRKNTLIIQTELSGDSGVFDIIAQNDFGRDSVKLIGTCDYKQHLQRINQPQVYFSNPSQSTLIVYECIQSIQAKVKNITNKNQIQIIQDGDTLNENEYVFDTQSSLISFNVSVNDVSNISILVKNEYGSANDILTLKCNTNPPSISRNFPVNPNIIDCSINAEFLISNFGGSDQLIIKENNVVLANSTYNFNPISGVLKIYKTLNPNSTSIFTVEVISNRGNASAFITYTCPAPKLPLPTVQFISPNAPISTIQNCQHTFVAKTTGIDSKNQIQVTVNGSVFSNFQFDAIRNEIRFPLYINTKSTIEITVNNISGSAQNYVIVECAPASEIKYVPKITFINPTSNIEITCGELFSVEAIVQNIQSKDEISVFVNNLRLANSAFEFISNSIRFNVIVDASQIIKIAVQNKDGIDSQTRIISCKKPINQSKNPPVLELVEPMLCENLICGNSVRVVYSVRNIQSKSEITIIENGNILNQNEFSLSNGQIIFNRKIDGIVKYIIKAQNIDGLDSKTIEFSCTPPIKLYPKIITSSVKNENCTFEINALVENAERHNISIKLDDVLQDYSFENNTIRVNGTLSKENSTLEIILKNENGTDSKTIPLTCEKIKVPAPVIELINPTEIVNVTENCTVSILAKVQNVSNKNQITINANNQIQNFDFIDNQIRLEKQIEGLVNFQILISTEGGTVTKSFNYECKVKEIEFEIKNGEVELKKDYKAEVKVIGAAIPNHEVMVQVQFGDLKIDPFGKYEGRVKTSNVNDGKTHTWLSPDFISADSKISIRAKSFASFSNNTTPFQQTSSKDTNFVKVLRNGDFAPNIKGWGNQADAKEYLKDNIVNGKIKLEDHQVIYLIEVGTNSTSSEFYDLQDCVLVISFY